MQAHPVLDVTSPVADGSSEIPDGAFMDERLKKAFDFAADGAKQLITLATGLIALTISFQKDILSNKLLATPKLLMKCSWSLYILSLFFGLWTLFALTGSLEPKTSNLSPSTRGVNVVFPAVAQILMFIAGLILTVIATAKAW